MSLCGGKSKAKVSITKPDGSKEIYEFQNTPIDVSCSFYSKDFVYEHDMKSPMSISFGAEIKNFESLGGSWVINTKDGTTAGCPTQTYNPIGQRLADADPGSGDVIHVSGSSIYSDFDKSGRGENYYGDNAGVCRYRVVLKSDTSTLKVVDNTGSVKNLIVKSCGDYQVSCDEDCPEGFCKCPSPNYPGYCCLDCASTVSDIRVIARELRSKNG
jgi:hypothetical protein